MGPGPLDIHPRVYQALTSPVIRHLDPAYLKILDQVGDLILTLPLTILSLGLFTFVINAGMLKMASALIPGFHLHGFWPAVFGALVISLVSWLVNSLIDPQGRVVVIRQGRRGSHIDKRP